MNQEQVRMALIGCGVWGSNHARVWYEMGHLRVVCDQDPARLHLVEERYPGLETCLQPEEVLAREDVDAVVIATPATTHVELTLQALEAGKDVLVEKPMAISESEALKVTEVASRNGSIVMVNHVLEYHPAVLKLQELCKDGVLGKVLYVYSQRLNFGRVRTEENALWSFAPHDVAMLLRLLGDMPTEVSCRGDAYLSRGIADTTLMSLSFPGDVQAHVFVSWLHPFKEHRFVVVGDRQMAVFDDTAPWGEKLLLYPHRIDWMGGRIPVAHKAESVPVALEEQEPLAAACEHFVECVRARRNPLTDPESGLRVLRVLEAGGRSLERGGAPVILEGTESSVRVSAHPTAAVDPGAKVGLGTRIWHHTHVMADADIGRDCILGQNVFVGRGVRVGDGVKVQNNVSLYEGVELEDHVFCGPSAVFTNVINPRSEVDRKNEFRTTLVKRGATLGANCTVICGVTIGRYALIGAGAVVTRDVPDHGLVVGVPAKLQGWVCECGQRLEFADGRATCRSCSRAYRQIGNAGIAQELEGAAL